MSDPVRRFLRGWATTAVVMAAVVAAVNAFVDPYLLFNMPRLTRINQRKPAVETHERLMKAYEVLRAAPNGLILGTSRVAIGLDTAHPAWPARARPVYNLGLAGADPFTSFRYLQHVLSQRDITVVVLGLDFEYFLSGKKRDANVPMGFEAYMNVDRDGRANPMRGWQKARDWAEGTLSLDALGDSIATVASTVRGGQTIDISSSGNLSEAGFRRETDEIGAGPLFAQRNRYNIRTYRGRVFSQDGAKADEAPALADLRAILELCRTRRIQVEMFIQPMHADLLETLDLLGVWPAYEAWKREMVKVSHGPARGDGRPVARLWDFSDYDRFSTESLPVGADRQAHLQWFWEPTHYSKALGDVILARIFSGRDTSYGVVLTAETVDTRLAEIREHRGIYRERHPEAVRRVREVYDSASP